MIDSFHHTHSKPLLTNTRVLYSSTAPRPCPLRQFKVDAPPVDTMSFVCVVVDVGGQTHPGLIEFSSGLLHVHISRMVIIVCYRLDQFAFNPDLRIVTRLAETGTGSHFIFVFSPSSSSLCDETNIFCPLRLSRATDHFSGV